MINDIVKRILLIIFGLLLLGTATLIIVSSLAGKHDDEAFYDSSLFVASAGEAEATVTEATKAEPDTEETKVEEATPDTPKYEEVADTSELIDTDAPVFLIFQKSVTIKVGSSFDVKEHMGYADDVDRDVDVSLSGSVDTSTPGTYPITVTLTDDAGHSTSSSMDVTVSESVSDSGGGGESTKPTESFTDFMTNYKEDNTVLGIDVSRWQGTVDYNKVKAAGCDFVIIRIGGLDDGELYTDKCYRDNIKNAKAAGLKVGIYWHAEEGSTQEVEKSLDYMLDLLDGEELDFPIAYDWEDFMHFQNYGMNIRDINDCFNTFCKGVEAEGYSACLYSSINFLEHVWTNEGPHPVWMANYASKTSYTGDYYMWQHSNTGSIDGISGAVDFNILYKED